MITILDYQVIEAATPGGLAILVGIALLDGWRLQGGVTVSSFYDLTYETWFPIYAQAMTK